MKRVSTNIDTDDDLKVIVYFNDSRKRIQTKAESDKELNKTLTGSNYKNKYKKTKDLRRGGRHMKTSDKDHGPWNMAKYSRRYTADPTTNRGRQRA